MAGQIVLLQSRSTSIEVNTFALGLAQVLTTTWPQIAKKLGQDKHMTKRPW